MEDMFELIVALIVIIAGICASASRSSRKKRPGQRPAARPAVTPSKKEPSKPVMQSKKPNLQQAKPPKQPVPAGVDMTPEAMIPEPMQPEKMVPELLLKRLESELDEGVSRSDANGCLGGSLEHDESTHQGVEFHADGVHGERPFRPEAAEPKAAAVRPKVSTAQLRSAVIWSEILDRPVSMRE